MSLTESIGTGIAVVLDQRGEDWWNGFRVIRTATLPPRCSPQENTLHSRSPCAVEKRMVSLQHFTQGILIKPNDLDSKKADILYKRHWLIQTDQSHDSIPLCAEECERKDLLE